MDEQDVLAKIFKRFRPGPADRRSRGVIEGVGDDAALVDLGGRKLAVTVDSLVEGVDFDLRQAGWDDVGFKAISASVSDLYACGALPTACLVSAGIPKSATPTRVDELLHGVSQAARRHKMSVIGGDLSRSDQLFLDVCSIGRADRGTFKTRRGARPGDLIFLSGPVGSSRAALLLMKKKSARIPEILRRAHFRPSPPRLAGIALGKQKSVTAMMDVSDGLLIDLTRLCSAGGVCAGIYPSDVPVHPHAKSAFQSMGRDPVQEAMTGGEDYALLFTVRPPVSKSIGRLGRCIGKILRRTSPPAIYNMERTPPVPIPPAGFVHQF